MISIVSTFKRCDFPCVYVAANQVRLWLEPTHHGIIRAPRHSTKGLVLSLIMRHQMVVKLRYMVLIGLSVVF